MPSISDLLFAALLFGLSCGAFGRLLLRDAGTGWHIRNGELMLQTHSISCVDPFSATVGGQPWYAWEWLYDLMIAAVHHMSGLNGVVFFTAAVMAATFVLVFRLAMRRGGNLPITFFLLVLSLGASAVHFLARPHVLSWLFTVIWFEVLDSAGRGADAEGHRRLFWLPLLMLLWVNLHGGFLLGFALLGVYFVGGSIEYFTDPGNRDAIGSCLKRLGLVGVLSLLATFVNPYGYKLHLHIYQYLSDRFLMNHISEFRSPDFHGVAQQCFAVMLLVTIAALTSARRKPQVARLLVILLAAYSGLYASRNLPVSSILLTLIIAPLLSETVEKADDADLAPWLRGLFLRLHSFSSRMKKLELGLLGHLWLVLACTVGLWACMHGGRLGPVQLINAYFDDKRFPVEAVDVIAKRDIRAPIFCPDQWGGYLIYRLYPETKVLVDDRHDLYGDQFFKNYLKVIFIQPGWSKMLEEEHADWVLVEKNSSLGTMLGLTSGWKLVHEDETAVLFQRNP